MTNPLQTEPISIAGTVQLTGTLPVTVSGTATITGSVQASIVGTASVSVVNFPATQTVAGTVSVNVLGTATVSVVNFPATQVVSGSVSVAGTVPVTFAGTSTVSVTNFPATQTVTGTLVSSILNTSTQNNILTGGTYTVGTVATVTMGQYQDLVVDYYVGSIAAGTFQVYVQGIEPQSGSLTSTLVSGNLLAATLGPQSQRLVAAGPLGAQVAVVVSLSATATVGPAYLTAQPSATG